MATASVFRGSVDDAGKFTPDDPAALKKRIWKFAGKRMEIVARAQTSQRSIDQNAFWWKWPVRLLAAHCGYTEHQMSYALLGECFGYSIGPTGKVVANEPSSSALDTKKFSHLIDWVLTWGPTEMGVNIPAPDEAPDNEDE